MGKVGKEEKSDGIEIISIGELYTGPWDKKYWSSSRGKDRYPYPVGYKSLRTQNGVTYTMEILEGLKGPSFMISSSDGKSCSGDTPDIAWDSFQKKGCSRLWHGKRFSCKIDGVEFFGFKNTFVQRLLRELVANVGRTAGQSLQPLNLFNGDCETVYELQSKASTPDPDLLKFLAKPRVAGKRSRKGLNSKQFGGKNQQEKCKKDVSVSNSKQRSQSICRSSDPSTFAAASQVSMIHNSPIVLGPENSAAVKEDEKDQPTAEGSMQLDSLCVSNYLEVGGAFSDEEKELTSSLNHSELIVDKLLQKREPTDRSGDIQEYINSIPQERDGVTSVEHRVPVVNDADPFVPDTLDYAGDSSSASPKNYMQVHLIVKDAMANDLSKSEVLATDSPPNNQTSTSANYNSEKCDADSLGQEIANSMMTVLLPRALPLLKTFTRKKKKSAKPSITLNHTFQEENKVLDIRMTDATTAGELAEHSHFERKNEASGIPWSNSDVFAPGNSDSVVPDSFDSVDPQDLLTRADADKAGQVSYSLDHYEQLPTNVNSEASHLLCHSGIGKDGINLHEGLATLRENLGKDTGTTDVTLEENPVNSKSARLKGHSIDNVSSIRASSIDETSRSECIVGKCFSDICIPEKSEPSFANSRKETEFTDCDNSSSNIQIQSMSSCSMIGNKMNDDSRSNAQQKVELNSKLPHIPKVFACYAHPMPISMLQLIVKENEIFICVKCGYSEHTESTLFIYKAMKNGENKGCPSLIGHMPIDLQISTNARGRDNAVERSLLQLTPDAQSLVLLNSIKTPYCREGKFHCSCPACTSGCCDKNAVKIVKLNVGYASLVTRLETTQDVCCILVCEPSFLLAAEEGGKLKMWVMNCQWSGQVEDWYLPTFDCIFPTIVELKRIPKCVSLVVGHNGLGDFGLWDIDKHNLVSRFSSPGMSALECLPVSIFKWQRKGECNMKVLVDEIMDATKTWNSGANENRIFSPDDNDVAVWLLISTVSDPYYECYQTCEQEPSCWRLALLANNTVIVGSAVDGGAAAVTSAGHGIIGRSDGLVYMWELSTGMNLETLHCFKGSRVSCITADASDSGSLAVASGGHLRVYLLS